MLAAVDIKNSPVSFYADGTCSICDEFTDAFSSFLTRQFYP